jgi:hypothetical protein
VIAEDGITSVVVVVFTHIFTEAKRRSVMPPPPRKSYISQQFKAVVINEDYFIQLFMYYLFI